MTTLVLLSGGLDSAVLAAHEAQHSRVLPVYVCVGLAWEAAEQAMLARLLRAPVFDRQVDPLVRVEFTMRDVYAPTHWAITGRPPAYDTPDEDVYLTGRNLVLLTKAGVVASTHRAHRIALGPLAGNPFPDARREFFASMSTSLSLGLDHEITVATPFLDWGKEDVIRRGVELHVPLDLTLSCMNPPPPADDLPGSGETSPERPPAAKAGPAPGPRHCGLCSKCRERRDAFAAAGVADPATYAHRSPR
jgi:7-cyano-7-deazaguanine synthase